MKTENAEQSRNLDPLDLEEIENWFQSVQPPYGLNDIIYFNSIYQRVYCRLTKEAKRRVEEEIVEALIRDIQTPKLKSRIFGVV